MPLFVNMNEIDDFQSVDAGKHKAKVESIIKEDSKNSGEPMLTWNWRVTTGSEEGKTIRSYTSLQEHARQGLKRHLIAFGLNDEVTLQDNDDGVTDKRLIGKSAYIIVTKRKTNSKKTGEEIEVSSVESVLAITETSAASSSKSSKDPVKTSSNKDGIPF